MKTILPIFTISIVYIHLNFDNTKHLSAHTTHIYIWVLLNNNNNNNIDIQQTPCWCSWSSACNKQRACPPPMYYNLYQLLSRHFYHCTSVFISLSKDIVLTVEQQQQPLSCLITCPILNCETNPSLSQLHSILTNHLASMTCDYLYSSSRASVHRLRVLLQTIAIGIINKATNPRFDPID